LAKIDFSGDEPVLVDVEDEYPKGYVCILTPLWSREIIMSLLTLGHSQGE